jgi:hypothetical protein
MQGKTFVHTVLAVAAGAMLPLAAHAQTIKLTLGHGAAVGNPRHEASVKFGEVLRPRPADASRCRWRPRRSWATTRRWSLRCAPAHST